MATASTKGTLIRLWDLTSKQTEPTAIIEFRRGTTPAEISNLKFDNSDKYLTVSSDHNTVHIFKLFTPSEPAKKSYWNYATELVDKGKPPFAQVKWGQGKGTLETAIGFLSSK